MLVFIQCECTICLASATQAAHTVAAGPGVHPSRVPQRGAHFSLHRAAFISQNQTSPPPPYNPIPAHTTSKAKQGGSLPRSRGLLRPANENRPEREGNPGLDQLLLQISIKKHKMKHIPVTNNHPDFNLLLFLLQASRLDKRGRYHKRWSPKTLELMKEAHFTL